MRIRDWLLFVLTNALMSGHECRGLFRVRVRRPIRWRIVSLCSNLFESEPGQLVLLLGSLLRRKKLCCTSSGPIIGWWDHGWGDVPKPFH